MTAQNPPNQISEGVRDENSERPDHWARWDDTEMGNTEKFCTRE